MFKKIILSGVLLYTGLSYGQEITTNQEIESLEEVVIIDSKFPIKRENSGKVITKITTEELAKSKGQTLAQVINRASGIEITGTRGNAGQNLGYYIRGGRNRQVVVMIDGIAVTDPSSIANDFDLRLLPLSQVASIEIVKGAASTLYGSGAATAVIRISTKKSAKKPIQLTLQSSVGTNQNQSDQNYSPAEFKNSLGISGNLKKLNYLLNFNQVYSGNMSAVNLLEDEKAYEDDPFEKYNFRGSFGYDFDENFKVKLFGNYNTFTSNYDNFDFTDSGNQLESDLWRVGSQLNFKYNRGSLVLVNSFDFLERFLKTDLPNRFESELFSFEIYNKYRFNDSLYSIIGLDANFSDFNSYAVPYGEEKMAPVISSENAHFEITDPYLNLVYISNFGLNLNAGARLNIHSNYGGHAVYNFNPSFGFDIKKGHLKVLTSFSTAYVTPSLYQLFHPSYGNEDLNPEESRTLEGGLVFTQGDFRVSTVYFNRREQQFIDFVIVDPETFAYQYQNIEEEFTAQGLEFELAAQLLKNLSFSGNYTFTEVADRFALRIPKHKINAGLDYSFGKNWNASLIYQYNGERTDAFFNSGAGKSEQIVLEGFGLLNLFVNYQINQNLQVFGSIYNMANTEFRELYGYTTRGRNIRLGFTLRI